LKFNNNYVEDGYLTVNKTWRTVHIDSGGELQLLDSHEALLHFDFEDVIPLGQRQVLGLSGEDSLVAYSIEIDGMNCTDSFINHGSFGSQYDAQACNIQIVEGVGIHGGRAGEFHPVTSRFALFATGPFSGGEIFSLSLWLKTVNTEAEMILVYYGALWSSFSDKKDYFLLTLNRGIPTIYRDDNISRKASGIKSIADGQWHHVVITMPRQSCLFSEIQMYIDGYQVYTVYSTLGSKDEHVFFMTSGRMNVGGLGYSVLSLNHPGFDKVPFEGFLDDISLWSRPLHDQEILRLSGAIKAPSEQPSSSNSSTEAPNLIATPVDETSLKSSPSNDAPTRTPIDRLSFAGCTDDEDFKIILENGDEMNCTSLLLTNTNQITKEEFCGNVNISTNCRSTCGTCHGAFWTSSTSTPSMLPFWGYLLVSIFGSMYLMIH